jgi:hypothetical protein
MWDEERNKDSKRETKLKQSGTLKGRENDRR